MKQTFTKLERLNRTAWIDFLFANGRTVYLYPLKFVYAVHRDEQLPCHQALFVAPKRAFKRAVDRNTIKRRMREGYRLQKHALQARQKKYLMAYIYAAKEILPSSAIHEKIKESFAYLPV